MGKLNSVVVVAGVDSAAIQDALRSDESWLAQQRDAIQELVRPLQTRVADLFNTIGSRDEVIELLRSELTQKMGQLAELQSIEKRLVEEQARVQRGKCAVLVSLLLCAYWLKHIHALTLNSQNKLREQRLFDRSLFRTLATLLILFCPYEIRSTQHAKDAMNTAINDHQASKDLLADTCQQYGHLRVHLSG